MLILKRRKVVTRSDICEIAVIAAAGRSFLHKPWPNHLLNPSSFPDFLECLCVVAAAANYVVAETMYMEYNFVNRGENTSARILPLNQPTTRFNPYTTLFLSFNILLFVNYIFNIVRQKSSLHQLFNHRYDFQPAPPR